MSPVYRWDGSAAQYLNLKTGEYLDSFTLGEVKPTRDNTGLAVYGLTMNDLEVVSGTQYHTTPGQTFYRKRFTGTVTTQAAGVKYVQCGFNTPYTVGNSSVVNTHANAVGTRYEFCDFEPSSFASVSTDGPLGNLLFGHQFTAYRSRFRWAVDAVGLYSGSTTSPALNVTLEGNHMGDMLLYAPHASQSDNRTHNDLIQIHYGADNLRVYGNNLEAVVSMVYGQGAQTPVWDGPNLVSGNPYLPTNVGLSALQFSPRNSTAGNTNTLIQKNWMHGGTALIYWNFDWATNARVLDNRWGRDMYYGEDFTVLVASGQAMTITGNVYEDNGASYNGRKNA